MSPCADGDGGAEPRNAGGCTPWCRRGVQLAVAAVLAHRPWAEAVIPRGELSSAIRGWGRVGDALMVNLPLDRVGGQALEVLEGIRVTR